MKLLFDIDDTLAQTGEAWDNVSREYLAKKGYKPLYDGQPHRNIEDNYDMTKQQKGLYLRFMWEHFDFRHLKPVDGAVETLAELINRGHKIDFVTARVGYTWKETSDWIRETFGSILPKDYMINYLKDIPSVSAFDVLIDDNPRRALLAVQRQRRAILVDPLCLWEDSSEEGKQVQTIQRLPELLSLI